MFTFRLIINTNFGQADFYEASLGYDLVYDKLRI